MAACLFDYDIGNDATIVGGTELKRLADGSD